MSEVIETLRAQHAFLAEEDTPIVRNGQAHEWWTFAKCAANVLLARILEAALGEKVTSSNTKVTFKDSAADSAVPIRQAIRSIAERQGPTDEEALTYAQEATKALSKFDRCLTEDEQLRPLRERLIDVEGAMAAVVRCSS